MPSSTCPGERRDVDAPQEGQYRASAGTPVPQRGHTDPVCRHFRMILTGEREWDNPRVQRFFPRTASACLSASRHLPPPQNRACPPAFRHLPAREGGGGAAARVRGRADRPRPSRAAGARPRRRRRGEVPRRLARSRAAGARRGFRPRDPRVGRISGRSRQVAREERGCRCDPEDAGVVGGPRRGRVLRRRLLRRSAPVSGRGECAGEIAGSPRGATGFGWDSIFDPEGSHRTFAELGPERKDRVSHRRRAWEALAPRIPMERRT